MTQRPADMLEGVPRGMPRDERPLWRSGPDGARLAKTALHIRKLALYFVGLLLWRYLVVWRDGFSFETFVDVTITTVLLAMGVLLLVRLYAYASARSTSYTVTSERIVIRTGIALSIAINLPFSKIASVDVRRDGEGGDIELTLVEGAKVGYLILWPSAKPLYFKKVRPVLRALASVELPVRVLGEALAQHSESQRPILPLANNDGMDNVDGDWQAAT
ncbi:MAG: photosynthetic complex putative assembly protein PuhB [Pseudomonadota bacterium]